MANLSQIKRERMIEFLKQLKEEHNDDISLIALNEIENELISKKYGLVWEKHEEEVDEKMKLNIPVFVEDKSREIVADKESGECNFLLEGDNLHSLKLLDKSHRGKVDVIYIDPPYNTGNNDFIYNDTYLDSNDGFKHSKWLSFMYERLILAKNLLSPEGAIFISIDANEFAQLKLLCDSIFGESNFIGSLIWRKKTGGGQTDEFFVTEHEYIFGYRKSPQFKWYEFTEDAKESDFKYEDEVGKFSITKLEKWGSSAHKEDRPTMYFPITDPDGNDFYPVAPDGKDGRWRVGKERLLDIISTNKIYWQYDKKNAKWTPYEKNYYADAKGKLLKSRSILWDVAETGTATKLLTDIFGEKDVFQNPKPIEILKFIFKHVKSELVVDFFAGSGSTAHAILDMNKEDKGNRHFILCTNNQNNICEDVTFQRIKTVITGKRADGSTYSDGIPANLKYYKTDFIAKTSEDENYSVSDALMKHIKEMVQLENGVNVDGENYLIILTDEDADALENNASVIAKCKGIYVSNQVFFTSKQERLFRNIQIKQIPDYYFEEELREVHEIW